MLAEWEFVDVHLTDVIVLPLVQIVLLLSEVRLFPVLVVQIA